MVPSDANPESSRQKVLASIRTASTPPTVDEIANSLGLHPNSVRRHAAALQHSGLITQESRSDGQRGRPLVTYRTTPRGAWTGGRNYELLASVLVANLRNTSDEPGSEAHRAGHAWGRRLAIQDPGEPGSVVAVLDDLGFEPTRDTDPIELRNCPFRDLVGSDQAMVCAIHAGMLDGLVDGSRTSITLEPFTSPSACTVHISRDGDSSTV